MVGDVEYRIDGQDRLAHVGHRWQEFATDNGAPHLTSDRVLGRPLWDFITDKPTAYLYRELVAQVRAGRSVRFPFRCDGPAVRRRMEMAMAPTATGGVEFRSRILAEEPRHPQPLLGGPPDRSGGIVHVCGWCKKVRCDDEWEEVEVALDRLRLFDQPDLPLVSHGICPACLAVMRDLLAGR